MNPIERYMQDLDKLDGRAVTVTSEVQRSTANTSQDAQAIIEALTEHQKRGNSVPWS